MCVVCLFVCVCVCLSLPLSVYHVSVSRPTSSKIASALFIIPVLRLCVSVKGGGGKRYIVSDQ